MYFSQVYANYNKKIFLCIELGVSFTKKNMTKIKSHNQFSLLRINLSHIIKFFSETKSRLESKSCEYKWVPKGL